MTVSYIEICLIQLDRMLNARRSSTHLQCDVINQVGLLHHPLLILLLKTSTISRLIYLPVTYVCYPHPAHKVIHTNCGCA